jgi:hypothetical protein
MRNFPCPALSAIRATCRPLLVLAFLSAILLYSCRIWSCSQVEGESEQYKRLRKRMVDQQIAARGIKDEHVLQAMRDVPRHQFVPEGRKGPHTEEHLAFLLSLIPFLLFILIVVGFYEQRSFLSLPFIQSGRKGSTYIWRGITCSFFAPFSWRDALLD